MNLACKYLAIVSLNLICYYRSLSGDFVFDDSVAILKNKDIYGLKSTTLKNVFQNDFWGNNLTSKDSHKSFRPLTTLTFILQHQFDGRLDSRSMKTVNLLIHIINCCLLLHFLKRIATDTKAQFLAILMFTVHPIHVEAVCGIVSRSDLLACLVFLLSGIIYFNVFHKDSTLFKFKHLFHLMLVVTFSLIGVLFKENAIMIMPTLAAIDFLKNFKRLNGFLPKTLVIRLTILTFSTLVILMFRLKLQNFEAPTFRREDNIVAFADDTLTKILTQNYLYVLNFFLLLTPDWLCFDWSFDSIELIRSLSDRRIIFIMIFYAFLLVTIHVGLKRRKILIALSLVIVPFLPASGIIKLGFVIAERILYIPSIGFSLLVGIGLRDLFKKLPEYKIVIYIIFGIFLTFHSMKTYHRALEWTTEYRLFHSALKVVPQNAKVYYNIARISSEIKDVDSSLKFYRKAIQLHPNYESAHMNLGNLYREMHQYEKAKHHLRRAVEILEEFPTAWMNLGIVQNVLKEHREAERSYFKALSYRKNYANCFYNLGNLYIDTKNFTSAIVSWKRAISINPNHQKAWSNILAFYDNQLNNHEDVLKYSEIALNYLPNDTNILFSRANTFGKLSRFEEAELIFKQIIQADPNKSIFYANLGVLYHRWGKKELAKKNYRIALSLDASLKNAHSNLMKLQEVEV